MKIQILAVGDKAPGWADAAVDEYLRRMPREWAIRLIPVRPERRDGQPVERIRATEAARLLERCPRDARIIALDERGEQWTTRQFADALANWREDGRDVALVIGGADGLDPVLLSRAERLLGLSRLTLPHALARVLLAEQLYRAWSLLAGHPYHRD